MRKSPRLRNDRREADCSADDIRQSSPGYSNVPASVLKGNRLSVTEGNRNGENLLDRMPQSLRFASPSWQEFRIFPRFCNLVRSRLTAGFHLLSCTYEAVKCFFRDTGPQKKRVFMIIATRYLFEELLGSYFYYVTLKEAK